MNSLFVCLIFVALPFVVVHGQSCSVCQLSGYFIPSNGYDCLVVGSSVYCTCPDSTFNSGAPCRICDRNPCSNSNPNFVIKQCLETKDFGTNYACLFADANGNVIITQDANGNPPTLTSTTPKTTTTAAAGGSSGSCFNGGVLYNGVCNCPSGYSQPLCATQDLNRLCDRVNCTANGYCIVRNYNGPYEASCTCKVPYFGDYCQYQGIVGSCSTGYCGNGGACKEFIGGSTKYAYCECAAGYNGIRCENRYFTCPAAGNWADYALFAQGKYFKCTALSGGGYYVTQLSCPKGLRFNNNANACTY